MNDASGSPVNDGRQWWARVGLFLLSLAVTLGVAEGVLRSQLPASTHHLMYVQSDDPLLSVDLKPGADFEFEGVTTAISPTRVSISSQGLRNAEVAVPKPSGVKRLLCVGDSGTFGWGVEEPECFCRQLQSLLGPGWETINLGIPGYNTTQEVRRLERFGLQFEPDLVMVFFDGNDYEPPVNHGDPDTWTSWFIDHFALVRWTHIRLAGQGSAGDPGGDGEGGPEEGGAEAEPHDGFAAIKSAFERLAELGKANAFQSAVFFPSADEDGLMTHLKTLGIPSDSLRSAFMGPPEQLQLPNDGHPSAEGHRRLAEAMVAALKAHDLVNSASDTGSGQ